jgi:hypothetical protein
LKNQFTYKPLKGIALLFGTPFDLEAGMLIDPAGRSYGVAEGVNEF